MIHVIIPVHNRIDLTINCLNSLRKQDIYDQLNIIIINDGSTDQTENYLSQKFTDVKVVNSDGSLYWGGAINLGIKHVLKICKELDWVLLVNNDVELKFNSISSLIRISNDYKRKCLSAALTVDLEDKTTIIKSGTIVKSWFFNKTTHVYKGLKINKVQDEKPVDVDFLTGPCLLHPVEVFKIAGNYDSKNFKHYASDDEFSMRVKKYGYRTFLCPSSIVFLKTYQEHKRNKISLSGLFFVLFNIKSSSNIFNKFKLTIKIVPFYAKISFFLIGVLKSLYIFFFKR